MLSLSRIKTFNSEFQRTVEHIVGNTNNIKYAGQQAKTSIRKTSRQIISKTIIIQSMMIHVDNQPIGGWSHDQNKQHNNKNVGDGNSSFKKFGKSLGPPQTVSNHQFVSRL